MLPFYWGPLSFVIFGFLLLKDPLEIFGKMPKVYSWILRIFLWLEFTFLSTGVCLLYSDNRPREAFLLAITLVSFICTLFFVSRIPQEFFCKIPPIIRLFLMSLILAVLVAPTIAGGGCGIAIIPAHFYFFPGALGQGVSLSEMMTYVFGPIIAMTMLIFGIWCALLHGRKTP